jgi:carbon starvation protein
VSSGTTARQIRQEPDAHPIGYGGMLMEAFLAVLVIAACASALPAAQYDKLYRSGSVVNNPPGLGGFLAGAGNVIADPFKKMTSADLHGGIENFCTVFIAVVVVSFAMTTLDSGTRLLRYDVESLGRLLPGKGVRRVLANRYFSSLVAVVAIGFIALLKLPDAKGKMQPAGITLWTLFGTSNQLLATLGLLIVTVYLWVRRKPIVFTLLPMLGMLAMVTWAMITKIRGFLRSYRRFGDSNNLTLLILSIIILCIAAWLLVEAVIAFTRPRPAATPDDADTQHDA